MSNNIAMIPTALQRTILKQLAQALFVLAAGVCLFLQSGRGMVAVPFLLAALLLAVPAIYTGWLAIRGHCLELKCVVLGVERSALRGRSKALLLETQGMALRLFLRDRRRPPQVGTSILIYISDTAQLYEWRGMHQLDSYLAVDLSHISQNQPKGHR